MTSAFTLSIYDEEGRPVVPSRLRQKVHPIAYVGLPCSAFVTVAYFQTDLFAGHYLRSIVAHLLLVLLLAYGSVLIRAHDPIATKALRMLAAHLAGWMLWRLFDGAAMIILFGAICLSAAGFFTLAIRIVLLTLEYFLFILLFAQVTVCCLVQISFSSQQTR
jgi:hypothetical protein